MAQRNARARRSIKNAVVSTSYYLILLALGFFSRKIFFDYLGSEILGLGTTAQDLLGVLNISELGIGAAIAFLLYKPLHEKNQEKIKEIITVQGWLYRMIAFFIIGASCVLMCFFPLIFAKSEVPLGYAYIVFVAFLIGSMLSYFYNYRQILLGADQKQYKIVRVNQGIEALKIIAQIFTISNLSHPFFWWIGLELAARISGTIWLDKVIKKEYPWLKLSLVNGARLNKANPEILGHTKNIFFHKIAGVVLANASSPILYAFTSLTTVAFYANYQLILKKISTLMKNLFSSTGAAIGDLVAEGNKESEKRVFWELFDSRLLTAAIIVVCSYYLTQPFISAWLSPDYVLGGRFLLIYLIMQGILMTRETVDSYINAHGMFQDIWAPMAEASINIGLSIFFGHLWGLEGIILGVTTSLVLIVCVWKPYFLFKVGFKESPLPYFTRLAGRLAVIVAVAVVTGWIFPRLPMSGEASGSLLKWTVVAVETTVLVSLLLIPSFLAFSQGTRNFVKRMREIIFSGRGSSRT